MFIYICLKHNTFPHLLRVDNATTRLFFVPNSHHVWFWDISLLSLSCSLSPTLTMYDYGIFRYSLYLVLCPQLSPCMIMGYFVTLSILFFVPNSHHVWYGVFRYPLYLVLLSPTLTMYDYWIFRYPLYLVLCPKLSQCMIMGYFVTLSILFFVPNSHHVWLWDISLPSLSCSLSPTLTMYDYGVFRYPLYLVLCPQLSPCMIMGYFVTLSILFFVPNSHHVWLWGISLPSLSCSLSPTLDMYDYGVFRYPLYLVLCPQLSPCMIMGYFVTLSILFFVPNSHNDNVWLWDISFTLSILFFVPNSHHVWLWDISLPSLSCSLSPTLTMYDYGVFRYPLYLVLCPQLSPCMIMGYFVTLSILFFVPNSHHVWLWGISLPSLSCSLSPTLTMYDYGIFRYPLYLVLCPKLSQCMIMGYFVTLSILFFVPKLSQCMIMGYFVTLSILFLVASLFCSRTICSFLLGHDVIISLILFTLGFALRNITFISSAKVVPFCCGWICLGFFNNVPGDALIYVDLF